MGEATLRALFNEELGAVVQVASANREAFEQLLVKYNLAGMTHNVGRPKEKLGIKLHLGGETPFKWNWTELFRAWNETSYAMQRLRDNPQSADQENEWRLDDVDPGISPKLVFDPTENIAAPYIATGVRPRVAILREQGVNGQVEMAAAFDRAGFEAVDVHMTDLASGRHHLKDFVGFAACGGFSYGDVLGAGRGWATSILYNDALREQFARFFEDGSRFALGVCNGCQMMSGLKDIIPTRSIGRSSCAISRSSTRHASPRSRSSTPAASSSVAWPARASRSQWRTAKVACISRACAARPRATPPRASWTTAASRPRATR